jgi:heat shock protein HspQ
MKNAPRLPGVDTAIKFLRPNAKFDLYNRTFTRYEDPDYAEPPEWEEVEAQIQKDVETYNYYLYARNRETEYGDWKDQLNLLYDDIKSGNLENGKWVQMVEAVKAKHPKPEGQPPQ